MTRYFETYERQCYRKGCSATDLTWIDDRGGGYYVCRQHDARGDY